MESKQITDASEQIDLWSRLRFDADRGSIWLDEQRMLLLHSRSLGALRNELIRSLGVDRASALLMRMGYDSGVQDAELARKLVGDATLEDMFLLGARLHSLEGMVKVETVSSELDLDKGIFRGEFRWTDSWEAEVHTETFGVGEICACWSQIGYASGYVSSYLGRRVVFRETMCRSKGDPCCYIIADTAENLADDDPQLRAFLPDDIADEMDKMAEEISQLRSFLRRDPEAGSLIGRSRNFENAFDLLRKAATGPITVLLTGETGVGKEVFARWLHDNGPRSGSPFIAINCGAIPHELIESELFGVDTGAYTGAQRPRPGRFERADGGTLFLDEIGDMPLAAQVKLLRVLQTGEVERLGGDRLRKVDVRLVAATNADLAAAVFEKRFRQDLLYRINVYPIEIPPLRDRVDDIPLFVDALLARLSERHGKVVHGLSDRAMQALQVHDWPGNIRELENILERGVILTPPGGRIDADILFPKAARDDRPHAVVDDEGRVHNADLDDPIDRVLRETDNLTMAQHEARLIREAMRRAENNISEAATLLGITRRQLQYWLKKENSR
tara:strand:+ start:9197 stop:10876 length:1680 start_codon:yes stop_codon:yes gene_type:complete